MIEIHTSLDINFAKDREVIKELREQIDYLNRKTDANAECNMELDKNRIHDHFKLEEVLRIIVDDFYEGAFRESMLDKLGGEKTVAVNSPSGRRAERNGDVTSIQTDSKPPRFRNVRKDFPHWFNKDGSLIENHRSRII